MKNSRGKQRSFTVQDVFDEFILTKEIGGLKTATLKTYQNHFHAISLHLDCEMDIYELDRTNLNQMILSMKRKGLATNSINSYTRTLKSFLSFCNEMGYTDVNIKLYKSEETIKETYTDFELKKLLQKPDYKNCTFAEYRSWVVINLFLNCGLRSGTAREILVKDVNFENSLIKYRHTKNGHLQVVPLCKEMVKILKDYIRLYCLEADDFLFPTETGNQLDSSSFRRSIANYNLSRGVRKTSSHLFRHSFAERYLRNGGDAFSLQKILGHSTLAMTKHYCNIYSTDLVEGFDKISPLSSFNRAKN